MLVICTRNLWYGPKISMGQRITNEINCHPEEVAKLREAIRQADAGNLHWRDEKRSRRPRRSVK